MRLPIKLNEEKIPMVLRKVLPTQCDSRYLLDDQVSAEEFERYISSIKVGDTWKSTAKGRHPITDSWIGDLAVSRDKLDYLEIGASAGVTSLDLLDGLKENFNLFYVTDLCFHLQCISEDGVVYFYNPLSKLCVMRVSDVSVIYNDINGAAFPFGWFAKKAMLTVPILREKDAKSISMVHPTLSNRVAADDRVKIMEYDIFKRWGGSLVDVVKVANVLNRAYFTDDQIQTAVVNARESLNDGGYLVVTDNRDTERLSIYKKCGSSPHLVLEEAINGGTDVDRLILDA